MLYYERHTDLNFETKGEWPMYCGSCGAKLTEKDARCPFCGTLNPLGAEAIYMEKLENIRQDTEALGNTPPEEYNRQLKHHGRFALKISLIVVSVFLLLFLFFQGIIRFTDYQDKREQRAQIAFQNEYFPILDHLYAEGDDEKVSEYLNELYEKDGSGALFHWKHQNFYYYYNMYQSVCFLDEGLIQGNYSDYELQDGFYCALFLTCQEIPKSEYRSFSEEECSKITGYQEKARQLLTDKLGIAAGNLEQVYDSCCENGYLSYELCIKYADSLKTESSD